VIQSRHPGYDLFVDTSGFFATINVADPYHNDATAAIRRAGNQRLRLCTTNFVVAETHALVLSREGRQVALQFIRSLERTATAVERVTTADESAAIAILEQYQDKDFSYTDAVSFVVMRRYGIDEVMTSDRHFTQFGFRQAMA
jgi:predicted nucleic acid-binding protein